MKRDTFAEILKKMKAPKPADSEDAKADEADSANEEGERITFDDYEKLMQKLEKERNWEQIQEQNPKAREYRRLQQESDVNQKITQQLQREKMRRML